MEIVGYYFHGIIGASFWFLMHYKWDTRKFGKLSGKKPSLKSYVKHEWFDLVLMILAIGIVVPNMEDCIDLYNEWTGHDLDYLDIWYFCPGPFTDLAYIAFAKIAGLKTDYVGEDVTTPTT